MEIKNLRYFLAVAREENMSHAAEILHVTQPTLSKVLKSLEDELGKKLFTRHSFSIKLTDEGMLLRDRAEDLVAMADKIEQEFTSLDDITGGDIYFGLAESYQISLLAREIKKLKDRYPQSKIRKIANLLGLREKEVEEDIFNLQYLKEKGRCFEKFTRDLLTK